MVRISFSTKIIAANIKDYDRINQESDVKLITKNLGENSHDKRKSNEIDQFDYDTHFSPIDLARRFPGIRGIKGIYKSEECVDRLQILLRKPLNGKKLEGTYMVD